MRSRGQWWLLLVAIVLGTLLAIAVGFWLIDSIQINGASDSDGSPTTQSPSTYWQRYPDPGRVTRAVQRPTLGPSWASTKPKPHPVPVHTTSRPVSHGPVNWDRVAQCESSGNWHDNTGNGYYGGLQMDLQFWRSYHGDRYAARPDLATKAQQIAVAEHAYRVRGLSPWPTCGRFG